VIVDSPQLVKDGVLTLEQGMSSGRAPTLIDKQQCAYAANATMRGGYAKNRPAFRKLILDSGAASVAWQAANFQGAGFYDIGDGQQHVIGMSSGRLYQLDLVGNQVTFTDRTIDNQNSPIRPLAYFCQADVYMVVQDGFATPIIMQGPTTIRRATANEVPVATAMTYGQGRLWISKARLLAAGDIFGGPTAVISFTENQYLAEAKGGFGVPLQSGDIMGLDFLEVGDTSTGQGDLLVFCRKAVWSVQAGIPRGQWITTPRMLSVSLTNIGGTGHRAIINANGDCYFRSKDGWRSYRVARNEQFYTLYGGQVSYGSGYAPISLEMDRVIQNDTIQLMDYGSAVLFKNRVLGLASPQTYQTTQPEGTFEGVYFRSIVALDFNIVSGMRQKQPPAWDGEWLGLNVLQLLANDFTYVERCLVFARNTTTGLNEIWEIVDDNYDANAQPIKTVIESRAMDCEKPKNLKQLRRGDLYFTNVLAETEVEVNFRSDGYPQWIPWHKFKINSQGQLPGDPGGALCNIPTCSVPGICAVPGSNQGGYWYQQPLPTPPTVCDPHVNKLIRNGFEFQFQIAWTGPAVLHAFVIHCNELIENPNGSVAGQKIC